MVFISLVAVRADLRLPGRIGSLVGKTFWSFEQIMEHRSELDIRHVFATGDILLLRLYEDLRRMDESHGDTSLQKGTARRTTRKGYAVVSFVVFFQWAVLLLPYIV
jgi:heptaprenyl diphosphate synthase